MRADATEALAALADTRVTLLSGVELPRRPDAGPARAAAPSPATAVPAEPVFDEHALSDVQGNVVPGFLKDHQTFVFMTFGDLAAADPEKQRHGAHAARSSEAAADRSQETAGEGRDPSPSQAGDEVSAVAEETRAAKAGSIEVSHECEEDQRAKNGTQMRRIRRCK